MAETVSVKDLLSTLKRQYGFKDSDYIVIKEQNNKIVLERKDKEWEEVFKIGDNIRKRSKLTEKKINKICAEVRHGKKSGY